MPKSMTGYGKGILETDAGKLVIYIKSLNHRNLDISVRNGQQFIPYDVQIRQLITQRLQRGWVEVNLHQEKNRENAWQVNLQQAKETYQKLEELRQSLGLTTPLALPDILAGLNLFGAKSQESAEENELWPAIETTLRMALDALTEMREREGERLYQDISQRVATLLEIADKMKALQQPLKELYRTKIKERLLEFNGELPENRLAMEIAILVEKSDYTEELVRIHSHQEELSRLGSFAGPIGKRLEFIAQELKREINTIGAKALSPELGRLVVDYKDELEKIREQIQNIE